MERRVVTVSSNDFNKFLYYLFIFFTYVYIDVLSSHGICVSPWWVIYVNEGFVFCLGISKPYMRQMRKYHEKESQKMKVWDSGTRVYLIR